MTNNPQRGETSFGLVMLHTCPFREITLRVQFSLARLTGLTSSPSPVRAWHARDQPRCSAHLSRNQYAPAHLWRRHLAHPIQTRIQYKPARPSRRHHCLPHHLAINPCFPASLSPARLSRRQQPITPITLLAVRIQPIQTSSTPLAAPALPPHQSAINPRFPASLARLAHDSHTTQLPELTRCASRCAPPPAPPRAAPARGAPR